ncbi:MAG: sulfite exporter TauE/SafE family protein [Chromatiales bacterium]|jgi:uncharacterized protein|nr:sulfite exporter TauE/SafE family protein [Chromatiales bacterium]
MKAGRTSSSAAIGLLAGVLNGLIALGGGIIVTPLLMTRHGAAPQVAVATSLAVVTVLSTIGFTAHLAMGGLILGAEPIAASVIGGGVGSVIGTKVLARITPKWMLFLFAAFVLVVAVRLIAQGLGITASIPVGTVQPPLIAYASFGLVAGLLSGVFGVGGGALVLLGLAAFYGLPIQEGLPVALALNVTNALFGLVQHFGKGRVLWAVIWILVPAACVGIVFGVHAAHWLQPDVMRVIFGGFFLFMGWQLARKGWQLRRAEPAAARKER